MLQRLEKPKNESLTLTPQQIEALQKMENFTNSSETMFGLYGYAGTGKSTILFTLIKRLQSLGKKVVMTAPTNKALTVLCKIAARNGVLADFCTIHQLLGLAPVRQGTERVLRQVVPDHLDEYDFVALDECSMVSLELWEKITDKIESPSLLSLKQKQLLVMGDPAQLPPVSDDGKKEKISPSFGVKNKAILTEVVRQGSGSPLLEFVTACRQAVKSKQVFKPFHNSEKKGGALLVSEQALMQYSFKKFSSSSYQKNPDSFRILCYTNKRVDYWNNKIREFIYGKNAATFISGERLIAKSPIIAPDGKTTILATSSEFEILEVEEDFYAGYKAWNLKVKTQTPIGYEIKTVYVLHKDGEERYQKDNTRLLKNAKSNPALWKSWYEHNEIFAQVRNCWALTVHNSQGSTFKEVGIDGKDINTKNWIDRKNWGANASSKGCNQLWYVATSRAEKKVLITTR